jgi:mono/diheme cytochrome c family protein
MNTLNKMKMQKGILFITLLALAACTPKTAEITEKPVSSEFPSEDIAQGSALYQEHCGKCHKHKVVTDFNQEQWKKIVPPMAAKSKIDATQENKVLQFVLWKTESK